ncbi:MAG: acetylxylan esterase, partial [Kiritimatiellaeota bacterium]|nr:acetylxylan esterase [Kiritimatiellota bacterium]
TRFTIQTETGYRVPCHFCVPMGGERSEGTARSPSAPEEAVSAKSPYPVAICLQGHTTGMHISLGRVKHDGDSTNGDRGFVTKAIREGFCALAIEQRGFGECGGDPVSGSPRCHEATMTALLSGRTMIAGRVWDVQRAIDALRHFPAADTNRILIMGNSGGGTTTLFASCLEPRIAYSMPSCYFCTFDDSIAAMNHCVCNFVPGIRKWFDMGDMAGMIAPRPLVIVAGSEDDIFPLDGVKKAFATAEKMYAAAGVPDKIALVVGEGGHRFYADPAWEAMKLRI